MGLLDGKKNNLSGLFSLGALASTEPKYTIADMVRGALEDAPAATVPRRLADALALYAPPRPDTEEFIEAVWGKARQVPGIDGTYVRMDRFGVYIARSDYGKCNQYGWHIDHVIAKSRGGSDELFNREPLHWRNNLAKSDRAI